MKVFFSDHLVLSLPPGHHFPKTKYTLLHQRVLKEEILSVDELFPAPPASPEMILRVHSAEYFQAVLDGSLDLRIVRQIGIPWSPELVKRALAMVGGTVAAAEEALRCHVSGNLAGGTHHAMVDQGNGYCVFNDIAVAILHLLSEKKIERAAVIDLDAHQGNGSAAILGKNPQVFILDMYCEKNYPFHKVPPSLSVELAIATTDEEYLQRLEESLPAVFASAPQIIFYLGGVDSLQQDRMGKLALSMEGLAARDRLVLNACHTAGVPVVITCGGGYAEPIDLTVQAYAQTYAVLKSIYQDNIIHKSCA